MRFDESAKKTAGFLIAPATLDADNTPAAFDIGTADACTIAVNVGVGGITFSTTNKVEFKLRHGDTATAAEHVAVGADDVVGVTVGTGGIVRELIAAHAAASVTLFGYVGGKRYVSLLADFSGTHGTGTPMSALAIRERLLEIDPA